MSWKDNLLEASFRGVPFQVEAHDSSFGRRTVMHEYPKRDRPFTEDLGRKSRRVSVTAYVVGDDYMAQRDRLLLAIEQEGPGTLVHPYLGSMQVTVKESRLQETLKDGRMARLTITFVETGEMTFPSQTNDSGSIVNTRANLAASAIKDEFLNNFVMDKQPDFITTEAQTVLSDALEHIERAGKGVF